MRIQKTDVRSLSLRFDSIFSIESKWLSVILLSATLLLLSTIMPMAQTSIDQDTQSEPSFEDLIENTGSEAEPVDFFKLSDEGHTVTFETLDIEEEMQRLLDQACAVGDDDDREAALSDCGFGLDFSRAVNEAQRDQLATLMAAQTKIIRLKAEAAVAEQRWTTAMLVQKANEAELAAGIVIDADSMTEVMSTLNSLGNDLESLSILVEGDPNSTDAGLDEETASLQTRISEIEEAINVTMENSNVMAEAMFAFCGNNPDVSWCRMLGSFQ